MKKIILFILLVLTLTGCVKKEDYYNLTFEDTKVAVGYDYKDIITDSLHINSYTTELDKKENEVINYLELYVKDLNNKKILLDDIELKNSIKENCSDLNGELISNNGNSCVLHKSVKHRENVVVLYGNILSDNPDELDRIEVYYLENEKNN